MAREQSVLTANFGDCTANSAPLGAANPQKSLGWPDGGVVTQRTANPLPPLENPDKFALFAICSRHGFPRLSAPTANSSRCPDRLSDRAVYLGDGVWWQLSEGQKASGQYDRLPQRIRPLPAARQRRGW